MRAKEDDEGRRKQGVVMVVLLTRSDTRFGVTQSRASKHTTESSCSSPLKVN